MKKYVILYLILSVSISAWARLTPAQQKTVDSLYHEVTTSKYDTTVAASLVSMSETMYLHNIDTIIPLCTKSIEICERNLKTKKLSKKEITSFKLTQAAAINNLGYVYGNYGDMQKQLEYFEKSLKINEELGDKKGLAGAFNSVGYAHKLLGNLKKAIEYYGKSIKIRDEIGDKKGVSSSYLNIGSLYESQGEIDKALEYYQKTLKIQEELNDSYLKAIALNNIGYIYFQKKEYEKAFEYNFQSLKIRLEIQDKKGIANSYHNIALAFKETGKLDSALIYYQLSLEMKEQQRDLFGIPPTLTNIGYVWYELGNFQKAKQFGLRSYEIAKKTNVPHSVMKSAMLLQKIYFKEKNYIKAYELITTYYQIRDSMVNDENKKAALKQNMQYEYDKKAASDSVAFEKEKQIKEVEIAKQKVELKAKRNQQFGLYGGLLLVLLFAGFMYNRFKVTQKQKLVIEEQKAIVESSHTLLEEKNKEITDSIKYAKRIQSAILPPTKLVKEYLPQSFILYKPKDIVAGDFYWMEHKNGKILFAAADCTGHGVPGAMVSVVCNNGLNRSVREHGLTDPAEILNKTREIVIQEFEKSDEEVKDGMDIAVCSLSGNQLQYAGANNPLWIIRNDELLETKADKQPIGKYADLNPFTTHTFELQPNDSIYIFTDGFHDQFGGDKGKKFKASQMKELILSIQDKNMDEQKLIINNTFETWKGALEQVDDVCVIGIRV